ncbi:MAG: GGDEF domain-containing protein, partial [Solirubrobacteraceae bacterium]
MRRPRRGGARVLGRRPRRPRGGHRARAGLLNHRAFHDRLAEEIGRGRRHGRPLALALVDVDAFRPLNDAIGHAAADDVLVEVARRLAAAVRAEDVIGRVGSDQFALLLPETTKL